MFSRIFCFFCARRPAGPDLSPDRFGFGFGFASAFVFRVTGIPTYMSTLTIIYECTHLLSSPEFPSALALGDRERCQISPRREVSEPGAVATGSSLNLTLFLIRSLPLRVLTPVSRPSPTHR